MKGEEMDAEGIRQCGRISSLQHLMFFINFKCGYACMRRNRALLELSFLPPSVTPSPLAHAFRVLCSHFKAVLCSQT